MGCDIHASIEVQRIRGSWRAVAIPDDMRNYELFGFLAGVRDDREPWVPLRGIPKDADCQTFQVTTYGETPPWTLCDGDHSGSWFTLEEAQTFTLPNSVRQETRVQ